MIAFVLGRSPADASVLHQVRHRLHGLGFDTTMTVVAEERALGLMNASLVVLRGLSYDDLWQVQKLEATNIRCCNSLVATARARDKFLTARVLTAAGIPTPVSVVAASWDEVGRILAGGEGVVKPIAGSRGTGVVAVTGNDLAPVAPFSGPFLVQQRVGHDGVDRKLYVVGDRVGGVLRRWPPTSLHDKLGTYFDPDPALRRLALAAGAALGLEIYGVDVVVGATGPVVVDVNAFPGFKGVPEAASWIAEYLASAARATVHADKVSRCGS